MKTQFLNGDDLWNPFQGLLMAAGLMEEVKDRIESGQLDLSVLGPDVPSALEELVGDTHRLADTIGVALTNAVAIRDGENVRRIRIEFPNEAKIRLENIQWFISDVSQWHKSGKFAVSGVSLDLHERYYEFSPESRFAFAARSIAQCIKMAETGFFEPPEDAYVPLHPEGRRGLRN